MKYFYTHFAALLLMFGALTAQNKDLLKAEYQLASKAEGWFEGYDSEISGENIQYHSLREDIKIALISNTTTVKLSIEWKTSKLPDKLDKENITFVWLAGVDIANRHKLVASFSRLKQNGTTLIFTSHYIEDLHTLADDLLALRDGQCTYYGSLDFTSNENASSLSSAISYYTS